MLDNIQRLESAASQAMQIDDAFTIKSKLRVPHALASTMPDQCTLQFLVPSIVNMGQILDDVLLLI